LFERVTISFAVALVVLLGARPVSAEESAERSFQRICATCHGATPVPRAMSRDAMAQLPPEEIYKVISEGRMAIYAFGLGLERQRELAVLISSRAWGESVPVAQESLVRCSHSSPLAATAAEGPRWSGWSQDLDNTRFQPADQAVLEAADLAKLELRWAFGFPGTSTAGVQPAVLGGRLFVGAPAGGLYSLDAKRGCAHWKFATAGPVRATPIVTRAPIGEGFVVYAVDRAGWAYALDADSGELRWKARQDPHPMAAITASPALYEGTLFLVIASTEKGFSASPDYACCTFRGSVVAVDAATGEHLWKT
jgi:polyvinyl alcohol dehydrogenase (cytochrome)